MGVSKVDREGNGSDSDADGEQASSPGPEQQAPSTGETVSMLEVIPVTRAVDKELASLETSSDGELTLSASSMGPLLGSVEASLVERLVSVVISLGRV